eukprot:1900381-Prymnesium_polylepis.1
MAEVHFRRPAPDRSRECSLLRCWSETELAPFLHDQDDQRDAAVGRCRQRACEGRRRSAALPRGAARRSRRRGGA